MSMTHPFDPECLYELTEEGDNKNYPRRENWVFYGRGNISVRRDSVRGSTAL